MFKPDLTSIASTVQTPFFQRQGRQLLIAPLCIICKSGAAIATAAQHCGHTKSLPCGDRLPIDCWRLVWYEQLLCCYDVLQAVLIHVRLAQGAGSILHKA